MIPLWTTATVPVQSTWGWALPSVGPPWVAQRVWPMPVVPDQTTSSSASAFSRFASFPALRATRSSTAVDDRDPGRVVAAVLEAAQAVEGDLERILVADVAHDAAHDLQPKRRAASKPGTEPAGPLTDPVASRLLGSDDGGDPLGRRAGLLGGAGFHHDAHERLGAGRAQQYAAAVAQFGGDPLRHRPAPGPQLAVSRSARTLISTCGSRVMTLASSASGSPVAAIRSSSTSAVSSPSPVVACSAKTTCPLCSPPSV